MSVSVTPRLNYKYITFTSRHSPQEPVCTHYRYSEISYRSTMDFYRLRPEALPRKLYRVDYHDSWSKFVPGTGFQAATSDPNHSSITTTFDSASDIDAFWKAMRDQLNPRSAVRSPFVALFSNGRQAKNWALRWEVRNQRACHVVEISPMVLLRLDIPIFHPHTLRFRIPDLSNTQGSEYLCLHSVPEAAVVSRRSTSTIVTGEFFRA